MTEKMTYGVLPLYKSFVIQINVDDEVIQSLNKYLDVLQESKSRKSHAHTLVGQIRQQKESQQLLMDYNHEDCRKFKQIVLTAADVYRQQFFKLSPRKSSEERIPQIDDMWSVHSYEGDYNTMHTHGCKTLMGISSVLWTKVPKQITDLPIQGSLQNASGANDGFLGFVCGDGDVTDVERLKFSGYTPVKPEVGSLYVFPSWLQHLVWPFFGEGERRTVATNINMFQLEQLSPEDQERWKKHKTEQEKAAKFGQGSWGK